MKKNYESPLVEWVVFQSADEVTVSGIVAKAMFGFFDDEDASRRQVGN